MKTNLLSLMQTRAEKAVSLCATGSGEYAVQKRSPPSQEWKASCPLPPDARLLQHVAKLTGFDHLPIVQQARLPLGEEHFAQAGGILPSYVTNALAAK